MSWRESPSILLKGSTSCCRGIGQAATAKSTKPLELEIAGLRSSPDANYLPKEWTEDPDRLEATYVPADTGFATKPKLATRMIARAIAAAAPFKWVAGDTVYGVGDIEQQLRQAGKGYVLGVSSAHVFRSWGKRLSISGTAAEIAATRRPSDWKRLSAGDGTKGPRLHDWCYLELADLDAGQFNSTNDGLWTRGLLIRRRIADGDLAFFTTWCPAATTIETLVTVEGHRWAIEDSFETAKNEFGLDHNESRSWHGWHRHVSMAMLAFAMMAVIRHHANPPQPKKTQRRTMAKQSHSCPAIDPMVNPGNSAHRHQARPKTDQASTHHRMVTLAQSSPGNRKARPPQSKTATVMLGSGLN
jgi:SRSO17 transposase